MPQLHPLTGAITAHLGQYWFDARTIEQDCSFGLPTPCKVVLSDGTVVAETGTNLLRANGRGVWALVEYPGHPIDPEQAVYRDSFGRTRTNFYPCDVGPDGAIAGGPHSGLSVTVIEADGREWAAPSPVGVVLCGQGRLAWSEDGYITSNFGAKSDELTWGYDVDEEGDVLYQRHSDGALVLNGHLIEPPSDQYFYAKVRRIGGRIWVTWSPNQGDTDGVVRAYSDAELAALPLSLATPPPVSVPAINRRLVVAWFTDQATDAPGNADVRVDFHGGPAPNALVRRDNGEVLAHYVAAEAEGTIEALERAIAAAHAADPRLPTVCYWPVGLQHVRVPIGADIVGVVAYAGAGEPLGAFEARVRAAVAVCPAAMVIAQCYTNNAANTADMVSLVPVYARIARDCRNVLGILCFSAGTRASGYDAHPEVADLWRALFSSVSGLPALPAPHVTPPPPSPRPPRPSPAPVPAPPSPPATRFPAARIFGVHP